MSAYAPPLGDILRIFALAFAAMLLVSVTLTFGFAALLRVLAGDKARTVMLGIAVLLGAGGLVTAIFPRHVGPLGTFLFSATLLTTAAMLGVFLLARRAPDLRRRP